MSVCLSAPEPPAYTAEQPQHLIPALDSSTPPSPQPDDSSAQQLRKPEGSSPGSLSVWHSRTASAQGLHHDKVHFQNCLELEGNSVHIFDLIGIYYLLAFDKPRIIQPSSD